MGTDSDEQEDEETMTDDKAVFGAGIGTVAVGSALAGAAAPLALPVLLVGWGLMFLADQLAGDDKTA